ncbi:MAG: enoyl-CoA hydratase/isomerase family protein [Actinobacteria bacterium]|nr:enoyl-CoA hydratase/isomerase family protein [Actinomycetota bacterium]
MSSRVIGGRDTEGVVLVEIGDRVSVLTFNRPGVGNAVTPEVIAQLSRAVQRLREWAAATPVAAAVVVTGAGNRAFVSGADLRYLESVESPEEMGSFSQTMQEALAELEDLPVPVIAALEGPALGGGTEVAWACDLRVMARNAYLSFKYARVGVVPGWGGCRRLVSLVGRSRALLLMATAAEVSAEEAFRLGLVNRVVEPGEALAAARGWAEEMAAFAPLSVRELKRLLRHAASADREASAAEETLAFVRLWASEDHKEGLRSLSERRVPRFQGR